MSEKKIKRTCGGLAWPGSQAGAVVILGQEYRHKDNFPKAPDLQILYHVLGFYESADMAKLIQVAQELGRLKGWIGFYARTNHKAGMDFLELYNRERMKNGLALFHLVEAPYTAREEHHRRGSIEPHLSLLREYLKVGKKRLIGLEGTKLPAYLNAIGPLDVSKLKDLDHPAVSALAYALAALVPSEHHDQEQAEIEAMVREIEAVEAND